ncbi:MULTISPECIES: hypothetical protein [unclassified Nostoc]|uniref:hypothetical protein n=1 Tax=unclassified Nostoc TaxID=2593658 RepID=UPI0025AAD069|nr:MULTISPECIES: hypothetical protein [unclassified Nostoc]MDM9582698.1 hypothetical protein [Nostoc sp. GT001]MDZ7944071.1 hypothetical protein [Nostoc sp. EfeVER01]MDZ7991972.1 hypothetical protein [Nostoc sp. EspVER01]
MELRQRINALFGGEVKKVNQIQEYFNWIFYLKWALGSQGVGRLCRLLSLLLSKLCVASLTREAIVSMAHEMQRKKTFSNFSLAFIVPITHYFDPLLRAIFLVKIAHYSQI